MTAGRNVLFLPGIIAPVAVRYAPLLEHLSDVTPVLKELEIYRDDVPPPGYSIELEIEGVGRAASDAGFDRFHIYGHSGGGAVALAFAGAHGERVLSLAVDEPAWDFLDERSSSYGWDEFDAALALPPDQGMRRFAELQVSPQVKLPPPPDAPVPPWMSKRPAGVRAFIPALRAYHIDPERYRAFRAPVYFSRGSLTHPRWASMQDRLAKSFDDFTAEVYEGLHHMNTSHTAEPKRVADALEGLWARAEEEVIP